MGKAKLGHLERVEAVRWTNDGLLVIFAVGTNTTIGCTNWFAATDQPNVFDFNVDVPDPIEFPNLSIPFAVTNVFGPTNFQEIQIRELDAQQHPTTIKVQVRDANIADNAAMSLFVNNAGIPRNFFDNRQSFSQGKTYRYHLGTFDLPCGCATWQHPTRARRYEAFLVVEIGGNLVQDVSGAVNDCLRSAAVASALVSLLDPTAWGAAVPVFKAAMLACLAAKLRHIIRVDVELTNHCL